MSPISAACRLSRSSVAGGGMAVALTVAAVAGISPGTAGAQTTASPLPAGAQVRVTSPQTNDRAMQGSVIARVADTLVVRPDGTTDSISIPVRQITHLEVSRGRERQMLKGIGLGFLIGGASGAMLAGASYKDCHNCFLQPTQAEDATAGGIVGVLLGSLIGGVFAAVHPTQRWEAVALASASRLQLMPIGEKGLSVSLTF